MSNTDFLNREPYRDVRPRVFRGPTTCFVISEIIGVVRSGMSLDIYLRTGETVSSTFFGPDGEATCTLRFLELSEAMAEANR